MKTIIKLYWDLTYNEYSNNNCNFDKNELFKLIVLYLSYTLRREYIRINETHKHNWSIDCAIDWCVDLDIVTTGDRSYIKKLHFLIENVYSY